MVLLNNEKRRTEVPAISAELTLVPLRTITFGSIDRGPLREPNSTNGDSCGGAAIVSGCSLDGSILECLYRNQRALLLMLALAFAMALYAFWKYKSYD